MSDATNPSGRPLAVVTGASSGIGLELAKLCAQNGHDLVIAADRPMAEAEAGLRGLGAKVETVQADLATTEGVDQLVTAIGARPVDVLCANAGHGLGHAFLDQQWSDIRHVIDTNVTGTVYLLHRLGQRMRSRGQGRILITGSIAGYIPGTYHAVYNSTKAFIDSFAGALAAELKDQSSPVTVTVLMPGPTETEFFERAGMQDTAYGAGTKDDAAFVARKGFDAMMKGQTQVVPGLKNKLQTVMGDVLPANVTAAMHGQSAKPGSAA
ncbi:MAG TPA: SDR family NAD(P)-dependent oxidoreductase [Acetobacteraceae bacterium]|nr:SDR family NAD(P)-dependent oxidoreductase [Acetobacteraceae bacterium]